MKIKYSPCIWNQYAAHNFRAHTEPDTDIKVIDENTVEIDGEVYEFDVASVQWPDINTQTEGVIQEAHRENEELHLTIRRFYQRSCAGWDTGTYHDVMPEMVEAEG